ncbi:MAG TPA: hypothetical protein VLA12_09470, partial [Planctomycetaceae bacterium]|nr:hypothetical protein [Planctomycetaceae bacterium]
TKVDFQGGVNAYLYGTRFFSYLALSYSPAKVAEWLSRSEDSKAYYSKQFEHVFGRKLTDVWDEWIEWEHFFQRLNLSAVRQFPVTETEHLSPQALGSVSRAYYNPRTNSLVGAFRFPGVIAHIGEISLDDAKINKIRDIKGPMLYRVTSLAYDVDSNTAWYTTDNYAFRDIIQVDVGTGKSKRVLTDARIGDIAFNKADKSLWGVRHLNGYPTLVRIPPPYTSWNQIHTFDYRVDVFDLDISPDGTLLAVTTGSTRGQQTLGVYRISDLMNQVVNPIASYQPPGFTPEGNAFSADGKYVFGSNYYTGVSNIFRLEVATNEIEFVSNAETGFFRPIPMEDGSLIVFEYTGEGFTPVRIDPQPLEDVGAIWFLGAMVA